MSRLTLIGERLRAFARMLVAPSFAPALAAPGVGAVPLGFLAMAEDGGDGGGGGDAGGDAGGDGGAGDGAAGDGGEGDGWTPPSKADWDNLNRRARESTEALQELQSEQEASQRKAQEDEGKFRELYEQEKAAREKEREERESERAEIERERRRGRGERIASRLRFRDPVDALSQLSDGELESDSKAERALKKLAESKPYLIQDSEKRPNRDLGDGDRGGDGTGTQPTGVGRLERAYAANSD